jgi:cobalamin biosynthesis Mg chelatase CobN
MRADGATKTYTRDKALKRLVIIVGFLGCGHTTSKVIESAKVATIKTHAAIAVVETKTTENDERNHVVRRSIRRITREPTGAVVVAETVDETSDAVATGKTGDVVTTQTVSNVKTEARDAQKTTEKSHSSSWRLWFLVGFLVVACGGLWLWRRARAILP